MNDSDNRLNKGEDKSGSIYFLSRAPMIIYHRHSAVLMPLEKHTVAFCWGGAESEHAPRSQDRGDSLTARSSNRR